MSGFDSGVAYLNKEMKVLVGGRILVAGGVDLVAEEDGEKVSLFDDPTPLLKVLCLDGKLRTVCFLQDPEGNGPGHPAIEED